MEGESSMFGYIRVYQPDMRFREMDCYRGVYCGLCRAQGACTGQCSRLMLSYDFAFMALVRSALCGETVQLEARRCAIHPFRSRPVAVIGESIRLTALSASLLAWHKLQDDRRDEYGGKRLRAELAIPLAASARRRALRRTVLSPSQETATTISEFATDGRALDTAIAGCMTSLQKLEAQAPPSVDAPAELFGELLAHLLAYGLTGNTARIARQIGIHTGRWIYILDAADDYTENVRHGRYNPFACLCPNGTTALPESNRESIRLALDREASCISDALDLLEIPDKNTAGAIRNIVCAGMPHTARHILFPTLETKTRKRN